MRKRHIYIYARGNGKIFSNVFPAHLPTVRIQESKNKVSFYFRSKGRRHFLRSNRDRLKPREIRRLAELGHVRNVVAVGPGCDKRKLFGSQKEKKEQKEKRTRKKNRVDIQKPYTAHCSRRRVFFSWTHVRWTSREIY